MSDKHVIYGDWRDVRAALEKADPDYMSRSEEERGVTWKLIEGFLVNYAPLKAQCWGCREVFFQSEIYRCADCRAPYCERCIKPHFGPNHISHPLRDEWLPIETAPRDGNPVLLYKPDERMVGEYTLVGYWGEWPGQGECWIAANGKPLGYLSQVTGTPQDYPTMWIPVPQPPKELK